MPKATDYHASDSAKVLLIGDSGAGKTGSLASLAKAGYNLRILDFDNGLPYLLNLLRKEQPEALENIFYETLQDKFSFKGGQKIYKETPEAFQRAMKLLEHWKTDDEDLGPVKEWTSKDVLVIDSLTFMCDAALRAIMYLVARLNVNVPRIQDWGAAIDLIQDVLSVLYQKDLKCNMVMTAHVVYVLDEGGAVLKGYPSALGQKLPPKVGRYFNAVLRVSRKGVGANERRVIETRSSTKVELKVSGPDVPAELPIETGLADYFKLVTQQKED